MSASVSTRTNASLHVRIHGPDPLAIIRRCRELGWTPVEERADFVDVDLETEVDPGKPFDAYVPLAKHCLHMHLPDYPEGIHFDLGNKVARVGRLDFDLDVQRIIEQLATVPFETAAFHSLYAYWALTDVVGPLGYRSPMVVGATHAGWGAAFRGKGQQHLITQRWTERGPWKVWRHADVLLLQFHALDADVKTAIEQAKPGHHLIGWTLDTIELPDPVRFQLQQPGEYDAATKTLRVRVDHDLSNHEIYEYAAACKQTRDPARPFERVAFIFTREDQARAHVPRLWKYEHEAWLDQGGTLTRLDLDYEPPDLTPAWTRVPPLEYSHVQLGEVLRSGTGDEVRRATASTDGSPLLVTVTAGHPGELRREDYDLSFLGVAALAWIGKVEGQKFGDALVEKLPAGTRPASELVIVDDKQLAALGADLARILERTARAGVVLDGIRPELIYVDEEVRFVVLAPRGPRFIGSARHVAAGPRSYAVPYVDREVAVLGKRATLATDVFALCATLYVLGTGKHPFGDLDSLPEIMRGLMSGEHEPFPRAGELGALIERGLAADPDARPSPAELVQQFTKLAKG